MTKPPRGLRSARPNGAGKSPDAYSATYLQGWSGAAFLHTVKKGNAAGSPAFDCLGRMNPQVTPRSPLVATSAPLSGPQVIGAALPSPTPLAIAVLPNVKSEPLPMFIASSDPNSAKAGPTPNSCARSEKACSAALSDTRLSCSRCGSG